jgi:hypothetical protein
MIGSSKQRVSTNGTGSCPASMRPGENMKINSQRRSSKPAMGCPLRSLFHGLLKGIREGFEESRSSVAEGLAARSRDRGPKSRYSRSTKVGA